MDGRTSTTVLGFSPAFPSLPSYWISASASFVIVYFMTNELSVTREIPQGSVWTEGGDEEEERDGNGDARASLVRERSG